MQAFLPPQTAPSRSNVTVGADIASDHLDDESGREQNATPKRHAAEADMSPNAQM